MRTPELVQRLAERVHGGGAGPAVHLVVEEVWLAVVDGSLDVGQRLPTPRELAIALGISPRSIERAYAELERRGVVVTRTGAGAFVSLTQPSEQDRARHRELADLCRETIQRAAEIGFGITDVLETIADLRSPPHDSQTRSPGHDDSVSARPPQEPE